MGATRVSIAVLCLLLVSVAMCAAPTSPLPTSECDVLLGFTGWIEDIVSSTKCSPFGLCPTAPLDIHNNFVDCTPLFGGTSANITALRLSFSPFSKIGGERGRFTGPLPTNLTNLPHLDTLYLTNNAFTGTLPEVWKQLTKLKQLFLDGNQLDSTLPDAWSILTALSDLRLQNNTIKGSLPASWSTLVNLASLQLGDTKLEGTIPKQWSTLVKLGSSGSNGGLNISGTSVCIGDWTPPESAFTSGFRPKCGGPPTVSLSKNATGNKTADAGSQHAPSVLALALLPLIGWLLLA